MTPDPGGVAVAASCHFPDEDVVRRYIGAGLWRRRSFVDDFLAQVARTPEKTAIVSRRSDGGQDRELVYGQLGELVDRTAAGLMQMGVERGDVVALQLPNGWEAALLCLATLRAGAIPNPLPPLLRRRELEYMLDHAQAKVFAVPSRFRRFDHAGLARELQSDLACLEHVIVTDESIPLGPADNELDDRLPKPDDVVLLLYTSGTTGVPKGALHSHDTIWSAGRALPEAVGLSHDDVGFMASTIGHLTGFYWGMLLPLSMGQTVVYQDAWDPDAALDLFAEHGVTWTLSATPFAQDLVKAQRARARNVDGFKTFVCGGAPIPPSVAHEVKDALDCELVALWGMTEVGICTIHRPGAPIDTLAASDGFIVDHMDVRIADESLEPVEPGTQGRLQVRGPSICLGYLGRNDLYDDAITPDGWFETGDLGRRVPDGGIRITGRSKDIILRGGENLPVAEIESMVYLHPNVAEVAVVAYPDERLGERACAVVVTEGGSLTLEDLTTFLEGKQAAKQYWPERLELVTDMPRTPAGKIQKFKLREWVAAPTTPVKESSP